MLKTCEVHVCVESLVVWQSRLIYFHLESSNQRCFNAHVCDMLDMRVRGLALGDLLLRSNYVLAAQVDKLQ